MIAPRGASALVARSWSRACCRSSRVRTGRTSYVQARPYALLAVGLNVVVGLAGLLDLGYVAFWAIGAYTMAILSGAGPLQFAHLEHVGDPAARRRPRDARRRPARAPRAAVARRLPRDRHARVRRDHPDRPRRTSGGRDSRVRSEHHAWIKDPGIPHPSLFGVQTSGRTRRRTTTGRSLLLLVAVVVIRNLEHSRIGRAWVAIREDEVAAEAMGIDTFRHEAVGVRDRRVDRGRRRA